jgi:hypothetical protein
LAANTDGVPTQKIQQATGLAHKATGKTAGRAPANAIVDGATPRSVGSGLAVSRSEESAT